MSWGQRGPGSNPGALLSDGVTLCRAVNRPESVWSRLYHGITSHCL